MLFKEYVIIADLPTVPLFGLSKVKKKKKMTSAFSLVYRDKISYEPPPL